MRRASSFDQDVAEALRKGGPSGVQQFIIGLTEDDGLPLDQALRITIKSMGIKEFCEMTGIAMPNVSEFLSKKRKPKPETLERYLKPFGLKIKLVIEKAS